MGWEVEESAAALALAGGDVVGAAEALAAKEEEDLERYGLHDMMCVSRACTAKFFTSSAAAAAAVSPAATRSIIQHSTEHVLSVITSNAPPNQPQQLVIAAAAAAAKGSIIQHSTAFVLCDWLRWWSSRPTLHPTNPSNRW